MSNNSKSSLKPHDLIIWVVIIAATVGGLVVNYTFSHIDAPLRVAGWIVLFGVLVGLSLLTVHGQRFASFIKDVRVELRKVTWPTRQETVQTAFIVALMVLLTAFMLWGLDSVLLWSVGKLTG